MRATANISNSPTTCELDCLGSRLSDCGLNRQDTLQTAALPAIVKMEKFSRDRRREWLRDSTPMGSMRFIFPWRW
jgi:hypothetical protein